jgi:hypothetical protein
MLGSWELPRTPPCRSALIAAVALLPAAFGLGACGGDDEEEPVR